MAQSNCLDTYLESRSTAVKIYLNHPKFTLGRSLNNSFIIEDLQISRTHCLFEEINGVWCLTDLSSNGTLLNQSKVPMRIPQILSDGDIITLAENYEYVFINKKEDSLNDLDFSAVIDESHIKCIDQVVEVVTSDLSEVVERANTIHMPNPISNVAIEDVNFSNTNEHGYCADSNINIKRKNENMDTINVECATATNRASTSSTCNISEQPVVENKINETVQPNSVAEKTKPSNDPLEQVEDELQCIICTELFIKATTLNCSHTFCKYCVEEWKKKNKKCPICRAKITTVTPTIVLDNFIAKVLESASDEVKEKRAEVIKSREKQETVPPIIIKDGRVLRSREIAPIEISSEEESSYDEENLDYDDYDDMSNYNGVRGAYYGGYGHCFSCGERGHWSNGCPYR